MKKIILNKYIIAAILFLSAAGILIAIGLTTNTGEFTTAAFVVSGAACAMSGIFVLTFSGSESVDARRVGLLTAQWCKNICYIETDLGITGNAYFLPPGVTGESRVMQFNPALTYSGGNVSAKEIFTKTGPAGLIISPSCEMWIQDLRKNNALIVPDKEDELIVLLSETIVDMLEFASRVSGSWSDDTVTLTFHDYRFIEGCKAVADESEEFCSMNPCPVCSLCGSLIAEGKNRVVTVDRCETNSSHDVTAVFSMLPDRKVTLPAEQLSTDEAAGSLH
jgi:hypothetical protein